VVIPVLAAVAGRIAVGLAAKVLAKQAAKAAVKQVAKKAVTKSVKQVGKQVATKAKGCVKGCPKATKPKAPTITIKAKPGWTPRQLADAKRKIDALNRSNLRVNKNIQRGTSETSKFKKINGKTGKRSDIDHKQDLQLGGKDKVSNMWKLDKSVNRSVGRQIQNQIKDLKHGTKIGKVRLVK
jgi:hypothetical protein